MSIDKQTVVRAKRDTLYSPAVFDLDGGPVTITLLDAGERFLSMQVFDEDQYSPMVVYGMLCNAAPLSPQPPTKEEIYAYLNSSPGDDDRFRHDLHGLSHCAE
jgi:hypothetical protein